VRSDPSARPCSIWREDLLRTDTVFQIGVVPGRIDLLTGVTGVGFEEAWASRISVMVEGVRCR
jgi:hypothetical protein